MKNQWMIYGASTINGKKVLNQAIKLGYQPILAGSQGQELVELSFQTGSQCLIFSPSETKTIRYFLENISLVVLCETLNRREHRRFLEACLMSGVHYLDMSDDIFSFQDVLDFGARFQTASLTAMPGLHPSVILSDFVAASLKSKLHDARQLTLACSEAFTSLLSIVDSLQRGPLALQNGKLTRPDALPDTLLIPFNGSNTLTLGIAQADILAAWHATRIPDIAFYRRTDEKEVRFRKSFQKMRTLLHIPLFKKCLRSQENFLIRHFGIKPFHPKKYAVWGRASNASG